MARIPIWDENDPSTPQEIREALEYTEEKFGQNLNIFRELANHPEVLRRYVDLAMCSYGTDSTLTPIHRELAYTTPSVMNNCHY